jgi:hypothetical protein
MTNIEEAARLALEALEQFSTVSDGCGCEGAGTPVPYCPWCNKWGWDGKHNADCIHERAVKALKEALK